jgi:non-ribosomal peptide synthetase component F
MDCGSNKSARVQNAVAPARDESVQDCPDLTAHDLSASVPRRFERMVRRYPDRLAVQSRRHAWTYAALNRNANRVARSLLSAVGPGCVPVALLFEHQAPVVACILGALKAGKFYAALDASFPAPHNASVLTDLRAPVLICDRANLLAACELAPSDCRLLVYEDLDETCVPEDPEVALTAELPFGVFYTSGSTGQPKGVQWNHNLPLHRVLADIADIGIAPADRQTLLTSFTFPASAGDICLALLNGASLHLYDIGKYGTAYLADWLMQEEITILRTPIALFRHFLSSLDPRAYFPTVRSIGLSGAALFRDDVERARVHFPQSCSLVHRYTLSEGGMIARFIIAADTHLDSPIVPAGYAVDGKSVLILDEHRGEVATNEIGEIACISFRTRPIRAVCWS